MRTVRTPARIWSLTAAALAAAACAATLAATPAAAAALPTPSAFGTSPAPLSGSASDPCGFTKPYGYIGNDDITFSAVISVPGGGSAAAEFLITPGDGSAPLDYTTGQVTDGLTAVLTVPRTDSPTGPPTPGRSGRPTAAVTSRPTPRRVTSSQTTTPPPPAGRDLVGPSIPAARRWPRTPGTFTFSVRRPGTGTVAFDYAVDGQLGAGGTFPGNGNSFVRVGASGTATTPTLIPTQPGPNWITVDSVDRAGNVSQPVTYDFVLKSPPPDVRGDLNGDGVPDLAAVTAAGNLQVYFGKGNGQVGPKTVFTNSGTGWKGALIAQNGNFTTGPYQDLLAMQHGGLVAYANNGLGDFTPYNGRVEERPNGGDWSDVTQLIAPGDMHRRRPGRRHHPGR